MSCLSNMCNDNNLQELSELNILNPRKTTISFIFWSDKYIVVNQTWPWSLENGNCNINCSVRVPHFHVFNADLTTHITTHVTTHVTTHESNPQAFFFLFMIQSLFIYNSLFYYNTITVYKVIKKYNKYINTVF